MFFKKRKQCDLTMMFCREKIVRYILYQDNCEQNLMGLIYVTNIKVVEAEE